MHIIGFVTRKFPSRQLSAALHSAGALVTAGIIYAAYVFAYAEFESQQIRWEQSAQASRVLLNKTDELTSRREEAECELFALSRRLEELTAMIPDHPDQSRFLVQLSDVAAASQLEIQNFTPGPSEDGQNVKRIRVQLTGVGSYQSLCRFLDGLHTLPRLTQVSRMKIDVADATDVYPVELELSIFYASPSATTKVAAR